MRPLFLILITILSLSCNQEPKESASTNFEKDLFTLQEYFRIPGMAALITQKGEIIYENYFGFADLETRRLVDSTTIFPINSLTKTYAAVLFMQLVEEGKVDLTEPVNRYLEDSNLSDSVQIKHLLSHTSEGTPGGFFNYSGSRYYLLTEVLEKISGESISQRMTDKILSPNGLDNTFPLGNRATLDSLANRLAKLYSYSDKLEEGRGRDRISAASGLLATVRDVARFDNALAKGKLVSSKSKREMFTPYASSIGDSPYGFGIFLQTFLGKQIKWGYGQGEYASSLLVKIPEDDITLILMANNNLMSDPARLINGDLTYSLFALSFLKHFVFDMPTKLDWASFDAIDELGVDIKNEYGSFYRQELLASAMAAKFIGYGDSAKIDKCKELTAYALKNFPDSEHYGNQSLMMLLSDLAAEFNVTDFDKELVHVGEVLLAKNPLDPYVNISLGSYYNKRNKPEKAIVYYRRIADVDNYNSRAWFWVFSLYYAGEYYRDRDPKLARQYFQKIVDINWNLSGLLDKAKEELKHL